MNSEERSLIDNQSLCLLNLFQKKMYRLVRRMIVRSLVYLYNIELHVRAEIISLIFKKEKVGRNTESGSEKVMIFFCFNWTRVIRPV